MNHTRLDIMENMNKYQEQAYDTLYRWIQIESRCMKEESPDPSAELLRGITCLQNRPILFKAWGSDMSTLREKALSRAFGMALSIGQGMTRPIDFHAHDLTRYAGDILAWMHQSFVSEREMLEQLFGLKSSAGNVKLM